MCLLKVFVLGAVTMNFFNLMGDVLIQKKFSLGDHLMAVIRVAPLFATFIKWRMYTALFSRCVARYIIWRHYTLMGME
jgi:hypothetical protein